MYRDPTYEAVERSFERTPSGVTYENIIRNALIDYCKKEKMPYVNTFHTADDKKKGTDLIIVPSTDSDPDLFDLEDFITTNLDGRLRIDITHNFSNKNNVLLLWKPENEIIVDDKPLQFGIRVANGKAGFESPVIVVGSSDHRERSDINSGELRISACIQDQIQTLFYEAGCAMATVYQCLDEDSKENAWAQPERLVPNYGHQASFGTRRNKEPLYYPSLQLAADLARRDVIRGKNVKDAAEFLQTRWIPTPTNRFSQHAVGKQEQKLKAEYADLCESKEQSQDDNTLKLPTD